MNETMTSTPASMPSGFDAALTIEQRRRLQQCFEQAAALVQRRMYDFDHAHTLLSECVVNDPGNVLYVEAMLENLRRKWGDAKSASRFNWFSGRRRLKQLASDEKWAEILKKAPDVLKQNPWDFVAITAIVHACQALRLEQAALSYLQIALDGKPDDPQVNRELARSFERVGRFDDAIECWHRVEETDPYDTEAPSMISRLTLERTRRQLESDTSGDENDSEIRTDDAPSPTGTTDGKSTAGKSHKDADEKPPRREVVLTERQVLELAIRDNPEDENNYLELAELYLADERTYDAQRTLMKAIRVTSDLRVVERLEDVNMLRTAEQVEIARQRADEEQTEQARELVEQLLDEQRRLEFEIFRSRSERYPDNHQLRFEFGLRLKRLGNFRQAIEPLQAGLELPELRAVASLEIGECLQRYKLFPKALQCYRQSAQLAAKDVSQQETRKRALYRAGVLADAMQLPDSAKQYFAELVSFAVNFKDARDRLDKLNKIDDIA